MRTLSAVLLGGLIMLGCGGSALPDGYMSECSESADCSGELECLILLAETDDSDEVKACSLQCEGDEDCPENVSRHCGNLSFCSAEGVCGMNRCL